MRPLPEDTYFQILAPGDYRKMWNVIRYGLLQSVPPTAGGGLDSLRKVLVQLLTGKAQVWLLYKKKAERMQLMLLTYQDQDPLTGAKFLIIYAVYGYSAVTNEEWFAVSDRLERFAKQEKCGRIIAFTAAKRITELAKSTGFADQYHLIAKELGDG